MLLSSGSYVMPSPSLADEQPVPSGVSWLYAPGSSIDLVGKQAAYGEIYRSQLWVYVLVRKIASGAARLPFKVYQRQNVDGRKEVRDSALALLLRQPHSRMNGYELWLWTVSTTEVYGEAMWLKVRDERGTVQELWPIHPANVQVYRENGVMWYKYSSSGSWADSLATWPSDDIVHFKGYTPANDARGLSPIEPLRQTLYTEDAARRASEAMWRNGARPSVLLTHPERLSDPAAKRVKASWDAAHTGVDSWGKTAVLEEGMTPHVVQLNAEEMQYIESRRLNREECCAVYDVPPPAVHILDRATFSNITEQMRSLYRDTMAPKLQLYESIVDSQLRPEFDPAGDLYGEFLMDDVLRGSFEERTASKAQAITTGQLMPSEAREMENLPFVEGTDRLFINAAIIPLGDGQEPPPPPEQPTGAEIVQHPQPVKSVADRSRVINGRLSRIQTVEEIDVDKLFTDVDDPDDTLRGIVLAAIPVGLEMSELRQRLAGATLEDKE